MTLRNSGPGSPALLELVLYLPDPDAAAEFLQRTAGFAWRERSPGFLVLQASDGLRIALRPLTLDTVGADGARLADAPPLPCAELVLAADDIALAHDAALAAGARSLMPPRPLRYGTVATVAGPGGIRVTWFRKRA